MSNSPKIQFLDVNGETYDLKDGPAKNRTPDSAGEIGQRLSRHAASLGGRDTHEELFAINGYSNN